MPITIRPATSADLTAIARVTGDAFRDTNWMRAMWPVYDAIFGFYVKRHGVAMTEDKNRFFVAVEQPSPPADDREASDDDTDHIIGYAKWTIYPTARATSEWDKPFESLELPPGGRQDAFDIPGEVLHRMRLKNYKGDPHVTLHFLAVAPGHQRKGVGNLLMQWGLAEGDRLGVPVVLEATDAGLELYQKNGFEAVDRMEVDGARWGVGPIVLTCMRRQPGARRAEREAKETAKTA